MRSSIVSVLMVTMASWPSFAQLAVPEITIDRETTENIARLQLGSVGEAAREQESGVNEISPSNTGIIILANEDSGKAKISLSVPLVCHLESDLSFSLSTPINKKSTRTDFITLDGPTDDIELAGAWARTWVSKSALRDPSLEFDYDSLEICGELGIKVCSDVEIEEALQDPNRTRSERAALGKAFMDIFEVSRDGRVVTITRAIPVYYSRFTASVGRSEREFFDLGSTEQEDDRLASRLQFEYGRVFLRSRLTLGLGYQVKFKENDLVQSCLEVPDSEGLEQCKELPFGEPAEIRSFPASIEFRFWGDHWAGSPKLLYDFEQEIWGASLPIYSLISSKGLFRGGVRLDWEEGKDLSASVFFGAPLTFN